MYYKRLVLLFDASRTLRHVDQLPKRLCRSLPVVDTLAVVKCALDPKESANVGEKCSSIWRIIVGKYST